MAALLIDVNGRSGGYYEPVGGDGRYTNLLSRGQ